MAEDKFSQFLGIQIIYIEKGKCELKCIVTETMLNGFHVAHGGITYSLSDSALAFASNSFGFKCMSIETSISHIRKVMLNDVLAVKVSEIKRGKSIGVYEVSIFNQLEEIVSHFKGIVRISEIRW